MSLTYQAIFVLFVVFAGCQQTQPAGGQKENPPATAPTPGRILGLDEGWELAPKATYTARQTGGQVTITARGEHPAANYEARLVESPLKIWPPQYMLARRQTADMGATVITPFDVTASFKSDQPVRKVRVSDAAGKHDVDVQQAAK